MCASWPAVRMLGGVLLIVFAQWAAPAPSGPEAPCLEALKRRDATTAEKFGAVATACGSLLPAGACRERFAASLSVGAPVVPVRSLILACRSSACPTSPGLGCTRLPEDLVELVDAWDRMLVALWRKRVAANAIWDLRQAMAHGAWREPGSERPFGSIQLSGPSPETVIRLSVGSVQRSWTVPDAEDAPAYREIGRNLEETGRVSGWVVVVTNKDMPFRTIRRAMAACEAAGLHRVSVTAL